MPTQWLQIKWNELRINWDKRLRLKDHINNDNKWTMYLIVKLNWSDYWQWNWSEMISDSEVIMVLRVVISDWNAWYDWCMIWLVLADVIWYDICTWTIQWLRYVYMCDLEIMTNVLQVGSHNCFYRYMLYYLSVYDSHSLSGDPFNLTEPWARTPIVCTVEIQVSEKGSS